MSRYRWSVPLLVAAFVMWGGLRAHAQVLDRVPSNALVVIKVNNLEQVSGRIGTLAQQWGIAGIQPEMADPLGALKTQLGISDGLNDSGEFALVILPPPQEDADPRVLALVPVQDYQAFVGNFQDTTTENDITSFTMPDSGETAYVAQWGDYAALTDQPELLENAPEQGVAIEGDVVRDMLDQRDITVLANMSSIRDLALPELQENRAQIIEKLEQDMSEDEAAQPYVPAMRALANQALDVAEGFLQQTESAALGIQLSEEGIGSTLVAEFRPDTYAADLVSQINGTNGDLISNLPDTPYLVIGGATLESNVVAQALEDFLAPVRQQLQDTGEEGQAIESYAEAYLNQLRAIDQVSYGMPQPSGQIGQGGIIQMIQVTSGDSEQIVASFKQMYQTQQALMSLFQAGAPLRANVSLTENAMTVDGVTFDKLSTEFVGADDDPQAAQIQQMMQIMYGPNGASALIGTVDDDVLTVVGGDEALVSSAVQAARNNTDPLASAQNLDVVRRNLPEERVGETYVMLSNILDTAATYAAQYGMPVPVQVPADLPPIGSTVAAEGSAVRVDTFVPSELVQGLISTAMQAMMQMQGAQQPGGPGGL